MLFDHVPDATLPEGITPPSRTQDLLEDYRMSRQRAYALQQQLVAEEEHLTRLLKSIKRSLVVGETVTYAGFVAHLNDHGGLTLKPV